VVLDTVSAIPLVRIFSAAGVTGSDRINLHMDESEQFIPNSLRLRSPARRQGNISSPKDLSTLPTPKAFEGRKIIYVGFSSTMYDYLGVAQQIQLGTPLSPIRTKRRNDQSPLVAPSAYYELVEHYFGGFEPGRHLAVEEPDFF